MNGLQAIELMAKGETVVLNGKYYSIIGDMVYITKGEDSCPCLAFPINHEGFTVAGEDVVYPKNVGRVRKGEQFYSITKWGTTSQAVKKLLKWHEKRLQTVWLYVPKSKQRKSLRLRL